MPSIASRVGRMPGTSRYSAASARAWPTTPARPSDTMPAGPNVNGFTMGDAAGIGPELLVKLFSEGLPGPAVVYGDAGILRRTCRELGLDHSLRIESIQHPGSCPHTPGLMPVLNRWQALP